MREARDEIEPELIGPFREISQRPALAKTVGLYTDIPTWINTAVNSRGCAVEANKVRFPIGFPRYDPKAQQRLFDVFANGTAEGSPFNTSMILLEQYSAQGVEAYPQNSSAYPYRYDDLLISPVIAYLSESDAEEKAAVEFGDVLRDILLRTSENPDELHAYVNYASGYEGPRAWYGYEQWRLEKLQKMKRRYDPKEKFSFYAPIPLS
jgi:tRNA pseudouridine synthase 9